MIRLTDLSGNNTFTMGGRKFEMGKVYSNPFATAFIKEAEGSEDHEVSMAQNQLDSIIKHATELKQKMGEEEKQIPAWIQDHITNSENYISQAASNYHEYGDSNENINESFEVYYTNANVRAAKKFGNERQAMDFAKDLIKKGAKEVDVFKGPISSTADTDKVIAWYGKGTYMDNKSKKDSKLASKKIKEGVNEDSPCWKGYKQVGMKDKGGKQVPNCVPESVVNEARSVGQIQKDFTKVIQAIASELEKYKSVKGTPKAKQYIANLKKLGAAKEKLEAEMDYVVSNIYVDAELQEGCGCK